MTTTLAPPPGSSSITFAPPGTSGDVQLGTKNILSPAQIVQGIVSAGGSQQTGKIAAAIAYGAESGGNAGITNNTNIPGGDQEFSVGLFQQNFYGGERQSVLAHVFNVPLSTIQADANNPAGIPYHYVQAYADNPAAQLAGFLYETGNGSNFGAWGPDFGYSGYGQAVTNPLSGSKVANQLTAWGDTIPTTGGNVTQIPSGGLSFPSATGANPKYTSWIQYYSDLMTRPRGLSLLTNPQQDIAFVLARGGTFIIGILILAIGLVIMVGQPVLQLFKKLPGGKLITTAASAAAGAVK